MREAGHFFLTINWSLREKGVDRHHATLLNKAFRG